MNRKAWSKALIWLGISYAALMVLGFLFQIATAFGVPREALSIIGNTGAVLSMMISLSIYVAAVRFLKSDGPKHGAATKIGIGFLIAYLAFGMILAGFLVAFSAGLTIAPTGLVGWVANNQWSFPAYFVCVALFLLVPWVIPSRR